MYFWFSSSLSSSSPWAVSHWSSLSWPLSVEITFTYNYAHNIKPTLKILQHMERISTLIRWNKVSKKVKLMCGIKIITPILQKEEKQYWLMMFCASKLLLKTWQKVSQGLLFFRERVTILARFFLWLTHNILCLTIWQIFFFQSASRFWK